MGIAVEDKMYSYDEYLKIIENEEDANKRYEYIDGHIYMLASPSVKHQRIIGEIFGSLYNYLKGGSCEPFVAPLDVKLYNQQRKIIGNVQPDVFVVCDNLNEGELTTPILVVEVVSPSSRSRDYVQKLDLYMRSGVREYWIIDPIQKKILQYTFNERELKSVNIYTDIIKSIVFEGLSINLEEVLK
ncbi:Uma2 family endonuclease [Crassaminicella indica]|uniref:Uma2 family endonuclease n=1 Tax=Crassaminicella indica TaxID=2855394 RepID=A0ABX8REA3_9CLOT|nr:Uma2 family endonuclease [Crassaminicella indica]QXM06752.1 Uma2 family endonuclease [Crassaminicella indica]